MVGKDAENERNQLLQLCEDLEKQVKEGHLQLDEAMEKIGDMEKDLLQKNEELEEVRERITSVAVLFEKKDIK